VKTIQKLPVQGRARGYGPKNRKGFDSDRPMTSAAAAYATGQHSQAPMIIASRDQSRIVHRELIASVVGSANFAVPFTFALQPGLAATFPWLATQAQSWESYRFNKLRFCAYTRTGSNVPGSLMLVPDYDATDVAPSTEQIASSYEDVEEDVPWKDICCQLRPASLHSLGPRKFIRTGALPANADVKTYDAGNMFICTTDGTAVNWSKLWVEYDVTLFTPQLPPGGAGVLSSERITGATPTTANILGTQTVQPGSSNLVSVAGSVVTFNQAGLYFVAYTGNGTTDSVNVNPTASANATLSLLQQSGSGTVSLTQSFFLLAVVGSTVTFNNVVAAGTTAQLMVSLLPSTQT